MMDLNGKVFGDLIVSPLEARKPLCRAICQGVDLFTYKLFQQLIYVTRNPSNLLLAARLALQIVLVSAAFRFLPLTRALKLINPRRARGDFLSGKEIECAHRKFVRATDALLSINRLMFTPTCWKRAAIIYRHLAITGIDARIVFGVRPQSGSLDGHAWVEVFDKPVFETTPLDYQRTFSFPSS